MDIIQSKITRVQQKLDSFTDDLYFELEDQISVSKSMMASFVAQLETTKF